MGQARQYSNVNWWLGLRGTEDCTCHASASGRSATASFPANIDYTKLLERGASRDGLVRTKCPGQGMIKLCRGQNWRWVGSGDDLATAGGYTQWNPRSSSDRMYSLECVVLHVIFYSTGEPNSSNENCVILWSKEQYNWADWSCLGVRDGPYQFKPVCQKEKAVDGDDDYYNGGGDDPSGKDDNNDNLERSCLEVDVKYKGLVEVARLDGVYSHIECRRQCALNSQCDTWSGIITSSLRSKT